MKIILQLALSILLGLFGALVMLDLYTWFVVPLGAPNLTLVHAYGLLLLKGLLTYRYRKEDHEWTHHFLTVLLAYLMVWGLGALAASMM